MRKTLIISLAVLALGIGGVGVASAVGGGDDDGEGQVSGAAADQARSAALKLVPGTANAVERDSEKGATWEVEITKPDGSTVDVRLDADLHKVAVDSDTE
jgi:hypothetical protein